MSQMMKDEECVTVFIYEKINEHFPLLPDYVNGDVFTENLFDKCLLQLENTLKDGEDHVNFFKELSVPLSSVIFTKMLENHFFDDEYVKYDYLIPYQIINLYRLIPIFNKRIKK